MIKHINLFRSTLVAMFLLGLISTDIAAKPKDDDWLMRSAKLLMKKHGVRVDLDSFETDLYWLSGDRIDYCIELKKKGRLPSDGKFAKLLEDHMGRLTRLQSKYIPEDERVSGDDLLSDKLRKRLVSCLLNDELVTMAAAFKKKGNKAYNDYLSLLKSSAKESKNADFRKRIKNSIK